MSEPENDKTDHGEIVARPRLRISWAWLFPVLAALAAGWLFWSDWKSQGPEIEVEFATAPGIEPGKTNLVYRGVVAGTVKSVRLNEKLQKVIVSVRLKSFASELAREGTLFWIDQPVIGLGRTSGIESLIQGNSLKARMGQGPPALHFTGSEVVPLSKLEEPGMLLTLMSANVPFLDRGSPIYHRGVIIGAVRGKTLNSDHQPVLNIMIEKEFTKLVTSNSRFWSLPAASVKLGSGMMQIDLAGLKSLLLGAITMECFGEPGTAAKDGDEFVLSANEFAARANSSPIHVTFTDGLGVRPGITELRYRGIPVGLVETVSADVATGEVAATVRLAAGYESLRGEGALFTLVRPRVSLEGISGIETLIAGIYIDCAPGDASRPLDRFAGLMATDAGTQEEGLTIQLHAKEIPTIDKGAPRPPARDHRGHGDEKNFRQKQRAVAGAHDPEGICADARLERKVLEGSRNVGRGGPGRAECRGFRTPVAPERRGCVRCLRDAGRTGRGRRSIRALRQRARRARLLPTDPHRVSKRPGAPRWPDPTPLSRHPGRHCREREAGRWQSRGHRPAGRRI